jgi:hypothetical protein
MTSEEIEKTMAFILEQQAQLTVTVGQLSLKVDRNAETATALLAIAEIQSAETRDLTESTRALAERQRESDERGRRADERLNALINIVERHISEGRNGKT